jgi:hypothetical protein
MPANPFEGAIPQAAMLPTYCTVGAPLALPMIGPVPSLDAIGAGWLGGH